MTTSPMISIVNDDDLGAIAQGVLVTSMEQLAEITREFSWTPAIVTKDGGRRRIKDISHTDFIGLDIDGGMTLDEALEVFKDYCHVITTSKSHQKPKGDTAPCDRFRVILKLSSPITSDASYKETFEHIRSTLAPSIDKACKDISRFFYRGLDIISVNEGGELIEPQQPSTKSIESSSEVKKAPSTKGTLSRSTKDYLVEFAPSGERHRAMVKALLDMKQQGWHKEQARVAIRNTYSLHGTPWGDEQDTRVEDIYRNREVKHVQRFPVLKPTNRGDFRPDPDATENYQHLIENVLGFKLSYNELSKVPQVNGAPITDAHMEDIAVAARENGLSYVSAMLSNYVGRFSRERAFNPLRAPIESAKLGGGVDPAKFLRAALEESIEFDYIHKDEINRAEEHEIYISWLMKWFIGTVNRLFSDDHDTQNHVIVFVGAQGIGKSRWCNALTEWCPDYYYEGHILGNKDDDLRLLDTLIWNIDEIDGTMSRRESSEIKALLTRTTVSQRRAYGRFNTTGRAITSFVASVNDAEFLVDDTGNRRFAPIPVKRLMPERLRGGSVRLFRAALELLRAGYSHLIIRDDLSVLKSYTEFYKISDPVTDFINDQVESDESKKMSPTQVLEAAGLPLTRKNYSALKHGLERVGIEQHRIKGQRFYNVKIVLRKKGNLAPVMGPK